ncbi:MAG: hypothetical protein O2960_05260 [Verrucomicrobia bacterium]|nr:hypothetical protein [Verrucomicrobiota bacterium]
MAGRIAIRESVQVNRGGVSDQLAAGQDLAGGSLLCRIPDSRRCRDRIRSKRPIKKDSATDFGRPTLVRRAAQLVEDSEVRGLVRAFGISWAVSAAGRAERWVLSDRHDSVAADAVPRRMTMVRSAAARMGLLGARVPRILGSKTISRENRAGRARGTIPLPEWIMNGVGPADPEESIAVVAWDPAHLDREWAALVLALGVRATDLAQSLAGTKRITGKASGMVASLN